MPATTQACGLEFTEVSVRSEEKGGEAGLKEEMAIKIRAVKNPQHVRVTLRKLFSLHTTLADSDSSKAT